MEPQPEKRRAWMKKESSSEQCKNIRLTLRDFDLFQALMTTRYMITPQIQQMFWTENRGGKDGQIVATRRRLKLLCDAGLIRKIAPIVQQHTNGTSPLIFALAKGGAQLLADHLGIELADIDYKPHDREGSWPFLQHLLDTTDIHIKITQAAAARGLTVTHWYNELEVKSVDLCDVVYITDPNGAKHKTAVEPDALFCLENAAGKQVHFQLETDKRSVTVEANPNNWAKRGWMKKIRAYCAHAESEAYKQRYGDSVVHVLTVTTGDVRLAHLKAATEKVTTSKRFWFSTFDHLTPESVFSGHIWQRSNMEGLHPLLG